MYGGTGMAYLEQFFDALRVDHIVGYFRSWEIPVDCLFGTMGCYSPSLPLTPDEIGAFGLSFKADLFTHPFITDKILDSVFGIHSQYVAQYKASRALVFLSAVDERTASVLQDQRLAGARFFGRFTLATTVRRARQCVRP